MSRSAGIMTWEKGFKFDNSVVVTLLNTTEEGIVDVCSVRGVSISIGNNTRVHALYSQTHITINMVTEDLQWSCSARCQCMIEVPARKCLSRQFGYRDTEVHLSGLR